MTDRERFADRYAAGRMLGERLQQEALPDPVVLALPRGGVPVGYEVARALSAPLDVFVARKIGAPEQPEFGIGAIAEGGATVIDRASAQALGLSEADLEVLERRELDELRRRVDRYRGRRALPALAGKAVVLVDDGLATGSTAAAALHAVRRYAPRLLALAAPVCAADTAHRLRRLADAVVCVLSPRDLEAIGWWYADFTQTSDDEVLELLADTAGVR